MQQPLFVLCGVLFRAWRPTHFLIEPCGSFVPIQVIANVISALKSFDASCHQQVSAIPQRDKLRLIYRLTTERV